MGVFEFRGESDHIEISTIILIFMGRQRESRKTTKRKRDVTIRADKSGWDEVLPGQSAMVGASGYFLLP